MPRYEWCLDCCKKTKIITAYGKAVCPMCSGERIVKENPNKPKHDDIKCVDGVRNNRERGF